MFCPNCGAEYRPGFQRCTDCDVDLVDQLPERREAEAENAAPAVVFVTSSTWEADLVKSLLEASGIEVHAINENFSRIAFPIGTTSGLAIQLAVAPDQGELARAVLTEYRGAAGENPAHGRITPFAGESEEVENEMDNGNADEYRCPKCNAPMEIETTVCPRCGYEL